MKLRKFRKGILFVVAASAFGLGCELIVDFDRTTIPIDVTDSATPPSEGGIDATLDTFQPDAADAADAPDAADAADAFDAADGD